MTQMPYTRKNGLNFMCCITQTQMINLGMDDTLQAMFSRWDQALAAGEVPAIDCHQWYGSLYLSTDDFNNTVIVAPVEEYNEDGIIDYVKSVSILFHKYNTVLCASCNYAEGTESVYGFIYCTSCANI